MSRHNLKKIAVQPHEQAIETRLYNVIIDDKLIKFEFKVIFFMRIQNEVAFAMYCLLSLTSSKRVLISSQMPLSNTRW